jgi:Kef-type K+ transport system membrane component KefB/nucleotide-binding universal stress UspA family protein
MLAAALSPIPGHSVFLLLIQLALLLIVARLGAGLARAFGLPAVVGELLAGIVLGPSVFGHYAPHTFGLIFPQVSLQFQLLEVVGLLGMVLLLLLTGLETDLRLLRNLGRAAIVASAMGMVVPFAMGFGLGMWMPESYLAQPDQRGLFSAFLATAMAISAMPVIAKILMDLDLTKRNIGLVILSAGVVDDTAGWLILSVIAGAAKGGGVHLGSLGLTVAYTAAFLLAMAFVAYPLLRFVLRLIATRARAPDNDLVVIIATTLLCAALTEHIGVHAVFGAFIVGTVIRQVPHLQHATIHRLESFVFSILAPVFFGIVGLKVDLWALGGGGGFMLGVVLLIACLGKLIGCTVGGLWGGMRFWEALSIAVAMNARGAMELVVATIGLSLGILNQQMFSIIVVVAIATSFMAPVGLRLTMRMVRMTQEEAKRMLLEESRGVFDPERLRILVPTAAGPNALEAARIAVQIAKRSDNPPEVLFINLRSFPWFHSLRNLFARNLAGHGLQDHLNAIQSLGTSGATPRIRQLASRNVTRTIVDEAARGFDVILIGASGRGPKIGGRVLEEVVVESPCHVVIVKATQAPDVAYKRLIVPIDGSTVARVAAEFALRYAEATGASLTLALISERQAPTRQIVEESADTLPGDPMPEHIARALLRARDINAERARGAPSTAPPPEVSVDLADETDPTRATLSDHSELKREEELARISPAFRVTELEPRVLYLNYEQSQTALTHEISAGAYDLVVLGAENRAVKNRMFFGYENQAILERSAVATLIVVPKIGMLK